MPGNGCALPAEWDREVCDETGSGRVTSTASVDCVLPAGVFVLVAGVDSSTAHRSRRLEIGTSTVDLSGWRRAHAGGGVGVENVSIQNTGRLN